MTHRTRDFGKPTEILADDDADVVEKAPRSVPRRIRSGTHRARCPGEAGSARPATVFLSRGNLTTSHSLWKTIEELCRPGAGGPWEPGDEEIGFLALLELFAALRVKDMAEAEALLDELRGDDDSVLVPVSAGERWRTDGVDAGPDRRCRRKAQPRRYGAHSEARGTEGDSLVPPASLVLDFVPDGLLETEREIDDAKAFGIRPFTVGNIVDRLVGVTEQEDEQGEIARFLWRLLTREDASEFSIRRSARADA